MGGSRPLATVVVPARNAAATLARTLAALAAQQFDGEYEVLVVDDGSSDATAAIAEAAPDVRLHRQPHAGPGAARNRGAAAARGTALAFCDADVVPVPGWLAAGVSALRGADIVQGRVLPDPSAPLGPFDRTLWVNGLSGLWVAANLFVTRDTFERVGGFEDWLWPTDGKPLGEDVLFGTQALRRGARPGFSAEALAHHAVFSRSWREYVGERRRLEHFPALARRAPELRTSFFTRRVFLDGRAARFDVALAGVAGAIAAGSPVPLLATLPYARRARQQAQRGRATGAAPAAVALADLAADAVGLLALLRGSARERTVLI